MLEEDCWQLAKQYEACEETGTSHFRAIVRVYILKPPRQTTLSSTSMHQSPPRDLITST